MKQMKLPVQFFSRSTGTIRRVSPQFFLFAPGALLLFAAIFVLLFPRLVLALFAVGLLLLGACALVAAYKFMQFRKRVEKVLRQVEARIIVVPNSTSTDVSTAPASADDEDKVTYH